MTSERTTLVLLIAASNGIAVNVQRAEEVARIVKRNVEALNEAFSPEALEALPGDFVRLLKEASS